MRVEMRDPVQFSHKSHQGQRQRESARPQQSGDSFQFNQETPTVSKLQFGNPANASTATSVKAQVNTSYYDPKADQAAVQAYYGGGLESFDGFNPSQLYDRLSEAVTKPHHPLAYKPDNNLYPQVDRHPDGNLYCIYSGGGPMFVGDDNHGESPMKGDYNCEHVVPQSWFQKKSTPRGDLHHLFACEIECNSIRGNAVLADFNINGAAGYQKADHGALDQTSNRFSPESGRGEVARGTLYFMLRYPGQIGDSPNEYSTKDLPTLIKWAKEDPPNEYEKHRNVQIQKMQGNRNPLIDFPQLLEKIDFSKGVGHY